MTSNNQKNIPPKKTDTASSKSLDSQSKPHAAGLIWTISGKHKTATINTRAVDMPVNCQKKSGKRNPPRWQLPELQSSC